MRFRTVGVLLAVGLVAGSNACSSTAPVDLRVGGFGARLDPDSAALNLSGKNGRLLIEGMGPSDASGQGFASNEESPPMTGFAVRGVDTARTMKFGAFRIDDTPRTPWAVVKKAHVVGDNKIDLQDDDDRTLASLQLSRGDDDAHLVVSITAADDRTRFSWGFRCADEDRFLGFGWQSWGTQARGESIPTWMSEPGIKKDLTTDDPSGAWFLVGRRHGSHMPMPEFVSRRGYMAVVESNARNVFAMCSERQDVVRMQLELPTKVHIFDGPTPTEALVRKTAHFGRSRVPPPVAFAPWNDAIMGSAEVRRVAKLLRDRHIPSSVIWSEDWRGGGPNPAVPDGYKLKEEWDVDRELYPDFEAVATELHAAGFAWHVYFAPFLVRGSRVWDEALREGYVIHTQAGAPYIFSGPSLEDTSLLDLTNPKAVAWAVGKMQAAFRLGADGFMGDYGEWLPTDAKLANGDAADIHNQYPVLWQQTQRTAIDTMGDGQRRVSFVRSGWFGTPQLTDVFWGGDQATDFGLDDGLPTVIPIGLGVGLSGVSTYGHDIGGYQTTGVAPTTKELFFRWTELGAWSPVMRTHHTTAPKASWAFDRDEETLLHWTRYAKLHMALVPYLRGLAKEAAATGVPIWRHLAMGSPDETRLWGISDQVLVGPRIVVAPVVSQGATSRPVELPQGRFFPWDGGASVAGPRITVGAALGDIPVFAGEGAIVPTFPANVETTSDGEREKARIVYVFLGKDGAFAEDGGPAYALQSSAAQVDGAAQVRWNGAPLSACAGDPCIDAAPGAWTIRVRGSGELQIGESTRISVKGADAAAPVTLVVRHD